MAISAGIITRIQEASRPTFQSRTGNAQTVSGDRSAAQGTTRVEQNAALMHLAATLRVPLRPFVAESPRIYSIVNPPALPRHQRAISNGLNAENDPSIHQLCCVFVHRGICADHFAAVSLLYRISVHAAYTDSDGRCTYLAGSV